MRILIISYYILWITKKNSLIDHTFTFGAQTNPKQALARFVVCISLNHSFPPTLPTNATFAGLPALPWSRILDKRHDDFSIKHFFLCIISVGDLPRYYFRKPTMNFHIVIGLVSGGAVWNGRQWNAAGTELPNRRWVSNLNYCLWASA